MKIRSLSPEIVQDKVVVVRVDFNVPVEDGVVKDTARIEGAAKTIRYLLQHGARRVHLLSHLGRPKGERNLSYTLEPLVPFVEKAIESSVEFRSDFSAGEARVQLHENTRFYPGEKENDPAFVQLMVDGMSPDIFVNDGFAACHRAHASVVGFADFVPCYAGFLVEKEIEALSPFLTQDKIPGLTVVMSGVKMKTKIPVLEHFARIADNILLGGGVANTFMVAQGYEIGTSVYEEEFVKNARRILKIANEHKTGIRIPVDVVCADNPDADKALDMPSDECLVHLGIFDIGVRTLSSYSEILQHSKTVIWNGPVGMIEKPLFEKGTFGILECLKRLDGAQTIIGGGDTIKALKKWDVSPDNFTHVSTGGGAMLEFLQGTLLPGIEIVVDN